MAVKAIGSAVPESRHGNWRTRYRTLGIAAAIALLAAGFDSNAQAADLPSSQSPSASSDADGKGRLNSVTVLSGQQREIVERQVRTFVSAITVAPWQEPLKRWRTPVCPLVAGLPSDEGEFILKRVSQAASIAGAPLASTQCRGNLYVVVTSNPEQLLNAWSKRDPNMFGDQGGVMARRFVSGSNAIRVWYNANLVPAEGPPLTTTSPGLSETATAAGGGVSAFSGIPENTHARGFRLAYDELRDLTSVIVMVDARRAKGINFDQLAGFIAMVGLAEVRPDANVGDAFTILQLFSSPGKAPWGGLSEWDEAYLSALYHTDQADKMQLAEIKTTMLRTIAP